ILVERWLAVYGRPPPKGISRRLLERATAYHLQLTAIGGMPPDLRRRLARLARGVEAAVRNDLPPSARKPAARLSPGTRLVREWTGRTYSVVVTVGGFCWIGRRWQSLSGVARAITGARWSGPRFFGL